MEQGAVMSGVCETVDRHIRRENRSRETAVRIGGVMPAPVSVGEGRRGRAGPGPTVETGRDARAGRTHRRDATRCACGARELRGAAEEGGEGGRQMGAPLSARFSGKYAAIRAARSLRRATTSL